MTLRLPAGAYVDPSGAVRGAGVNPVTRSPTETAIDVAHAPPAPAGTYAPALGPALLPSPLGAVEGSVRGGPLGAVAAHGALDNLDTLTSAQRATLAGVLQPHLGARLVPGKDAFEHLAAAMVGPASPAFVKHTFEAVVHLVRGPRAPHKVGELLEQTRQLALEHIAADPAAPAEGPARQHLAAAVTLMVLGAHALKAEPATQNKYRVREQFPLYLHDGRLADFGFDKCCHVLSHAFFSFFALYDQRYGNGAVNRLLMDSQRAITQPDVVTHIEQAYVESQGRVGALLRGFRASPGDPSPLFVQAPQGLQPAEQVAHDAAVAVGHMHEHGTSGAYAIQDVGLAQGPASAPDNVKVLKGLGDPAVGRDLTANRLGALLGVLAMRNAGAFMELPWDDGVGGPSTPYTAVRVQRVDQNVDTPDAALSHARARAVRNAVAKQDVSATRLVQMVLEKSAFMVERPAQMAQLGRLEGCSTTLTDEGCVLVAKHAGGVLRVVLSDQVSPTRGYAQVVLEVSFNGTRRLVKELPTTVLPTRAELRSLRG